MCFSPIASFTAGTLLVAAGAYCFIAAFQKNKYFILLALIPFFFGIQQLIEGMVWLDLMAAEQSSGHYCAKIYLFFAFAFWPIFIPASVYLIEPNKFIRKIILLFLIAGCILSSLLYGPVLLHMVQFKVAMVGHEILYDVYQSEKLMWAYTFIYTVIVIMPFFICSLFRVKIYGLLMLASLIVAYWWYLYRFTSVWCFFAAILSLDIVYILHKLRKTK